jgi:phage major head subunit gpT-like protein
MISVNPALLAALNVGFKKDFLRGIDRAKTLWSLFAMKVMSTNAGEVYPTLGRFPQLREWVGDRVVRELQISDFMIKNKPFEGTIRVPRPAIEDDSFGIYGTQSELLGDAAARFPDKMIFQLLEAGFGTIAAFGSGLCFDGQTFFSTAHPDGMGGTFSNKGTTALSSAAFAAALTQMQTLKDDGGELLGVFDDPTNIYLVVPPALQETARLILNADLIPNVAGTATQTNVWKGAAQLLVAPRLTDANDWYLIDTGRPIRAFIWQSRKEPQLVAKTSLTDDNVFARNEFIWGVDLRGNVGYGLPALAFGAHV